MTLSLPFLTHFPLRAVTLLVLLGASLLAQAQTPTIRYVRTNGPNTDPASATSWATSTTNLQGAIDASGAGDQVWVATGTYKPTTTTGPDSRTISFAMKNGVAIYGGFSATGSPGSLSERNPGSFTTVLSGDIGTAGNNTDNSYHVISNPNRLTSTAVLDGFIITGGNANGSIFQSLGGGILNGTLNPIDGSTPSGSEASSPTLRNCIVQNNSAQNIGGMANIGGNPTLTNCSFLNNSASQLGGGMANQRGNPTLINCLFLNNSALGGGGVANVDGNLTLTNCSFQNNSAQDGGGIFGSGTMTLTNCSFLNNSASRFAGGIGGSGNATLTNCVLFGNGGANTLAGMITARYSLFEASVTGYTNGGNNLTTTTSPFASTTSTQLNGSTQAIDAGLNSATGLAGITTDLAGNPRFFNNGTVDMGAYEYQAELLPIRYVTVGGAGTGLGDSWANASGDLQSQIEAKGAQQVWVATGTYKPTTTTGPDSRSISFVMKNGVTIYGGFAATGSPGSLSERNPGSFTTVLSGDIGTAGNNTDNSYHVISNPNRLTSTAVLDGFIITGGNANGSIFQSLGGGISNGTPSLDGSAPSPSEASSPILRNCLFLNNSASVGGGGISNNNGNPVLINCSFQSNSASQFGGGMVNLGGNPTLTNCSFQNNSALTGGGILNNTGNTTLTNCVLFGNGGANTLVGMITVRYSLFENTVTGYTNGGNNLTTTTSPFTSTTSTQLNACTLAINAGDPATTAATVGPIDLAGNARFFNGGRIDMGAYEAQGNSFSVAITATPSLTITLGQSATLIASGGFGQPADAYVWSTRATSNSIVVSVAGPYSVTATTTAGCSTTANVTLTVNPPACGAGLSGPVWTGCLSTDWNTAANWASGAVPTATDDVVIPPAPANQPVLRTPATAKSVEVQSGASLSITAAGSLTINDSKSLDGNTTAFSNQGTVQNAGQLVLGNTAAIGQIGFWNRGIANNAGGQISIDRSTASSLLNSSGTFTNTGVIAIAGGIRVNGGTVTNNPGGDITINGTGTGVLNDATFVNASRLTIGNVALSGPNCIFSRGTFTNTATGEIRADRASNNGIWNAGGTFRNDGKIFIGTVANTGVAGILIDGTLFVNNAGAEIQIDRVRRGLTNRSNFTNAGQIRMGNNVVLSERGMLNGNEEGTAAAVFTNQAGGLIQIDRTASGRDGLTNNVLATFTNAGTVTIGTLGSIGGNGIRNAGTFSNSACATLTVVAPINNGSSLTNAGLFTVSTTRTHSNTGTLTNNGLISYPQGNPIPNVINNDVIAAPISSCSNTINPALQLGSNSSQFSVGTTWYTDPALTQSAGTYNQGSNTFTATNLAPGSRTTLYVAATDQANGCTKTVSVSVTLNATVTASISPTNPTLTCASPTVSLTASGGSSYVWDDNSTNAVRTVSSPGTYSVTVSDGAGCSAVASVNVGQDNTTPEVSLASSGPLSCSMTSVTLTAGGGQSYAFSGPGLVSQDPTSGTAVANAAGVYSVTVTSAGGCTATQTTGVESNNSLAAPDFFTQYGQPTYDGGLQSVTVVQNTGTVTFQFSNCIGGTVNWSGQDGSSGTGNIVALTSQPGTLTYTGTCTLNSCVSPASSVTVTVNQANTPPMATGNANQTATVGVPFSYTVAAFTDSETPDGLTYTASIVPANGFVFDPATRIISGTPSMSGVSSVTVVGTDPGSLSASTTFTITVNPAPVTPTVPFAITGVTTIDCTPVNNRININFNPRYAGLNGQPISFSVVNELSPTTAPGPYTLQLYPDNPTIILKATQSGTAGEASFSYNWLAACNSLSMVSPNNTAPTTTGIANQSGTVNQSFSLNVASSFSDAETPNNLNFSATGLPNGLSLSGSTISGTPSTSGVSSVTVTATDPGSLSVSTSFTFTVSPAASMTSTGTFSITGVTTLDCTPVANRFSINFTPRYAGLNGQPIRFSVANELSPTTAPGPYSLTLYPDNPIITLKAIQSGTAGETTFSYNWLAACNSLSMVTPNNTPPTTTGIANQSGTVNQGFTLNVASSFSDAETPNTLSYSATGLPAGLSLSGSTISGTPSASGVSSVTVVASDPGSLSVATSFTITVSPASTTVSPPPTSPFSITGVSTVSCTVISAGQRQVSFTPQYAGTTGQPISFQVVNELSPTTAPGPYTLRLYIDNPTITLKATQSGTAGEVSFRYNWLAACTNGSGARVGAEPVAELQVRVLGNPVAGETVDVEVLGGAGKSLRLQVVSEQGYQVDEQGVEQAGGVERFRLRVGPSVGVYLLRVSSPFQYQTLKLLKK